MDRRIGAVAQGHVEHGAVFGFVDPPAREHLRDRLRQAAFPGQLDQQPQRFGGDPVLGKIHQEVVETDGEPLKPPGVFGEEVFHLKTVNGLVVGGKLLPGGGGGGVDLRQHRFSSFQIAGVRRHSADPIYPFRSMISIRLLRSGCFREGPSVSTTKRPCRSWAFSQAVAHTLQLSGCSVSWTGWTP